jgi:hypothetical protein
MTLVAVIFLDIYYMSVAAILVNRHSIRILPFLMVWFETDTLMTGFPLVTKSCTDKCRRRKESQLSACYYSCFERGLGEKRVV